MKKISIFLLIILIFKLYSYEWTPFGNFDEAIYNADFYPEELGISVLCGEDSLYILEDDVWYVANTNGLPIHDTEIYDEDHLLVVMGAGSSGSDGLYLLDLETLTDEVIEWMWGPRFIRFNSYDYRYYLGASPGIGLSPNAYQWTTIEAFGRPAFYRIANYNERYIISTSDGVFSKEFSFPPAFENQTGLGEIESDELDEISGIVASIINAGIFWVINDSGGDNAVYAFNTDGEHVAKIILEGAVNRDWEDIAIRRSTQEIFIADIGDNNNIHETKYLYYFEEPYLDLDEIPFMDTINVSTITFQYPDGNYDAETLMHDPDDNDLFIVTKRKLEAPGGEDLIFKLPYPEPEDEIITAELAGSISISSSYNPLDQMYYGATGGEISSIGDEIVIKTYSNVYYWKKGHNQNIEDVFTEAPVELPYIQEPQGEAICWDRFGTDYYTVSEEPFSIFPANLYKYQREDWVCSPDSIEIIDICFDSEGTCYGRSNAQNSTSYIYYSENSGYSWDILTESPYGYLGALTVDRYDNLFAGWRGDNNEPGGVALWDDLSGEFQFVNDGIQGRSINRLVSLPQSEQSSIVACTDSGAYFLNEYNFSQSEVIIPTKIRISNHPNPFITDTGQNSRSSGTNICFEMATDNVVEITIYNLKGQKVKTLVSELIAAGNHNINWNGEDDRNKLVSSGIYFCRLNIKGRSQFHKMVLLRS